MICLLGEPTLTERDQVAAQARIGRKGLSVLAVIASAGKRGVRREKLAALIWPDRDDAQASSVLRQALTALRKAFAVNGDVGIETSGDTIKLTARDGAIDVRAFEATCQAVTNGEATVENATALAALYRGEFMAGMSFNHELLSYILSVRQRHQNQALIAVEELSHHLELADQTETLATTLIGIEPAAEEAYRALIRLALARGKRNRALQLFKAVEKALMEELATEPDPETCALLQVGDAGESIAAAPAEPQAPVIPPVIRTEPVPVVADAAVRRPSIAVLPFAELGEPSKNFLGDAIVTEITLALSHMRDFCVIARQSSFAYKGRCVDAREAGAALGAQYILDGTLQQMGHQIRLSIQLVESKSGLVIMARSFESNQSHVLQFQVRIAQQVAGAIVPSIRHQEIIGVERVPPQDLNAYGLVLSAYPKFWSHERDKNNEAIGLFAMALAREPEFALAHGLKAWSHAQNACYLWADDPRREREVAIGHARAAAASAKNDATALVAIGAVYSMVTDERAVASRFIDRSLEIDPCNAWAWMRHGWLRVLANEPKSALDSFRECEELSPLDPFLFNVYFGQALAWSLLKEFDRAIALLNRGLEHGPSVGWAYRMLASIYVQSGDSEGMLQSLARFREHYPNVTITRLSESLPPLMVKSNPSYLEMLRRAGIPEVA